MVFVNDKKYACESCIKGHRSSSCCHTTRPLFEVKKKGRPVSQCPKCRDLRQAKRVHSKCTCDSQSSTPDKVPIPAGRPDKKPRRFMPRVPSLPNGISDALDSPSTSSLPVNSTPNPHQCKTNDLHACTSPIHRDVDVVGKSNRLSALADAAATFSERFQSRSPDSSSLFDTRNVDRFKTHLQLHSGISKDFNLPPILSDLSSMHAQFPEFAVMPPLAAIKSIAGSGCTCGLLCSCPGCSEHRPTQPAMTQRLRDCGDGCGDCVDHSVGVALGQPDPRKNPVDVFFDRARLLPNPSIRARRTELVSSTTYTNTLGGAKKRGVGT